MAKDFEKWHLLKLKIEDCIEAPLFREGKRFFENKKRTPSRVLGYPAPTSRPIRVEVEMSRYGNSKLMIALDKTMSN